MTAVPSQAPPPAGTPLAGGGSGPVPAVSGEAAGTGSGLRPCACGCGRRIAPIDRKGFIRRYAPGHKGNGLRSRTLAKIEVDLRSPWTIDGAPCWRWTGSKTTGMYGQVRNGGMVLAHRIMYELWFGFIPGSPVGGRRGDGLEIDHLCGHPWCVNPGHLDPVTGLENMARSAAARDTCKNGHEYTAETTTYGTKGERRCRTCTREHGAAYRAANHVQIKLRATARNARIKAARKR